MVSDFDAMQRHIRKVFRKRNDSFRKVLKTRVLTKNIMKIGFGIIQIELAGI